MRRSWYEGDTGPPGGRSSTGTQYSYSPVKFDPASPPSSKQVRLDVTQRTRCRCARRSVDPGRGSTCSPGFTAARRRQGLEIGAPGSRSAPEELAPEPTPSTARISPKVIETSSSPSRARCPPAFRPEKVRNLADPDTCRVRQLSFCGHRLSCLRGVTKMTR